MLLPIHPQPQSEELLSSWLTRLAIENGHYSFVFLKQLFNFDEPIFSRDLDRLYSPNLLQLLSNVSGQRLRDISMLSLASYQGTVFDNLNLMGKTRWILPLKIYHRMRRGKGIVYCPLCLKDDVHKYFRKSWRLAFVTLCNRHRCLLLDKCIHCNSGIDYQRIGIGSRIYELPLEDLSHCHICDKPLWSAPARQLPIELETKAEPYRQFLNAFHNGDPVVPSLNIAMNLQALTGIWFLVCSLMGRRAGEVRKRIYEDSGIQLEPHTRNETIEFCSLEQRLKYLIVIMHYMRDWPSRFSGLVDKTSYTSCIFTENASKLPFWLYSIVQTNLNLKKYKLSDEEILNATFYLNRKNGNVDPRKLANLLGIHVSSLNQRLANILK